MKRQAPSLIPGAQAPQVLYRLSEGDSTTGQLRPRRRLHRQCQPEHPFVEWVIVSSLRLTCSRVRYWALRGKRRHMLSYLL